MGRLKFSRLNSLNDIYEACRLECIDVSAQPAQKTENSFHQLEIGTISKAIQKFRQISLCMDKDDRPGFAISPMWGHYAEKGKGVCLVFDKEKFTSGLNEDYYGIIEYRKEVDNSIRIPGDELRNCVEYINNHKKQLFFTKDIGWNYEQEFRIVQFKKNNGDTYKNINNSLLSVIIQGYNEEDKVSHTIKLIKLKTLEKYMKRRIMICEYGTFLGEKNLRCQGKSVWSSTEANKLSLDL